MIDLSIVIVSWNVADMLADCLDSIFDNSVVQSLPTDDRITYEVIVVDSGSTDHTVEMVERQYPRVKLLPQGENIGYTRANNIGMQAASGRHILLLNPDTLILGNALAVMVNHLNEHPDVGIVGPFTLNTNGSPQSTRRRFPTERLAYFESTWLQPFAPRHLLDWYYIEDAPRTCTIDVDWVQGSALMLRRDVYEQVGGYDEGYVMYSEELDLCKRAKQAGWRVMYDSNAQIIHHGGKSTEQASARKHIYFQQSKVRYFRKHHGSGAALRLRLFLMVNYTVQIGVEGVKLLLGHKREMRRERVRVYWRVLRSGLKAN